jgi:hypothetical protein
MFTPPERLKAYEAAHIYRMDPDVEQFLGLLKQAARVPHGF